MPFPFFGQKNNKKRQKQIQNNANTFKEIFNLVCEQIQAPNITHQVTTNQPQSEEVNLIDIPISRQQQWKNTRQNAQKVKATQSKVISVEHNENTNSDQNSEIKSQIDLYVPPQLRKQYISKYPNKQEQNKQSNVISRQNENITPQETQELDDLYGTLEPNNQIQLNKCNERIQTLENQNQHLRQTVTQLNKRMKSLEDLVAKLVTNECTRVENQPQQMMQTNNIVTQLEHIKNDIEKQDKAFDLKICSIKEENKQMQQKLECLDQIVEENHQTLVNDIKFLNQTVFYNLYYAFINTLENKINKYTVAANQFYKQILNAAKEKTYTGLCKMLDIQLTQTVTTLVDNLTLNWGPNDIKIKTIQQLTSTIRIMKTELIKDLKRVGICLCITLSPNNEIQLNDQEISQQLWIDLFKLQMFLNENSVACAINLQFSTDSCEDDILVIFNGGYSLQVAVGMEQCNQIISNLRSESYHVILYQYKQDDMFITEMARKKLVTLNAVSYEPTAINLSIPKSLKHAWLQKIEIANIANCENLQTIIYDNCMEKYLYTAVQKYNTKIFQFGD